MNAPPVAWFSAPMQEDGFRRATRPEQKPQRRAAVPMDLLVAEVMSRPEFAPFRKDFRETLQAAVEAHRTGLLAMAPGKNPCLEASFR